MNTPIVVDRLISFLDIAKKSGIDFPVSFITDNYTPNGRKCGEYRQGPVIISKQDIEEISNWIQNKAESKFHFILMDKIVNISTIPTTNSCRLDRETARIFQGNVDTVYYQPNGISDLMTDLAEIKKILPDMKIRVMFNY